MPARFEWRFLTVLCPALLVACGETVGPMPAEPGEPLPSLGNRETARFLTGQALFQRQFTPEEGLGPTFNDDSCLSCHDLPESGGAGFEHVPMATRWIEEEERCDLLEDEGGPLVRSRTTPLLANALDDQAMERRGFPPSATQRAQMTGPALFGLGLVDAIPDTNILRHADNGGRPARTPEGELGRFGRMAEHASLLDFVAAALIQEMGITTPFHPEELNVDGEPLPPGVDPASNPELGREEVEVLTDYVRFLAPPERDMPDDPAELAQVRQGEEVFEEIGCAGCHVPEMSTGPSEVPALDERPVPLYSDLLLHDLGPEMEGVCGTDASPTEWRTAILMGLRFRMGLMNDDRAQSLERAIELHGGDAEPMRDAYEALPPDERQSLLRFLETL